MEKWYVMLGIEGVPAQVVQYEYFEKKYALGGLLRSGAFLTKPGGNPAVASRQKKHPFYFTNGSLFTTAGNFFPPATMAIGVPSAANAAGT